MMAFAFAFAFLVGLVFLDALLIRFPLFQYGFLKRKTVVVRKWAI